MPVSKKEAENPLRGLSDEEYDELKCILYYIRPNLSLESSRRKLCTKVVGLIEKQLPKESKSGNIMYEDTSQGSVEDNKSHSSRLKEEVSITYDRQAFDDMCVLFDVKNPICAFCKKKITKENTGGFHKDYIFCNSLRCLMKVSAKNVKSKHNSKPKFPRLKEEVENCKTCGFDKNRPVKAVFVNNEPYCFAEHLARTCDDCNRLKEARKP